MSWFGLYLVIREEIQIGDNPQWIMIGSGLILLSSTIYASYILIAKPIIMRIGASRYTSIVMCFPCAFILTNFGRVDGDVGSILAATNKNWSLFYNHCRDPFVMVFTKVLDSEPCLFLRIIVEIDGRLLVAVFA